MNKENDIFYYARIPSEQVLSEIQSNAEKGLTESEATNRLKTLGLNLIQSDKRTNLILDVLQHFKG